MSNSLDQIDIVLTVLNGEETVVYGVDIIDHCIIDDDDIVCGVARVPVVREESVEALAYCLEGCVEVTHQDLTEYVRRIRVLERFLAEYERQ